MSAISDCQNSLVAKAQEQGYLTFDDILDVSDTFNLSVSKVDVLSEAIQLLGIIVYESAPAKKTEDTEKLEDYSRVDYEAIYRQIIELSNNLKPLIDEIRQYPAPQFGEINILVKQISAGNNFARERLITLYLRTALKIALSMTKQYELDIEDTVASGIIGLCIAVDRYDPNGFSAFNSFASLWIQQTIQRECKPKWMDYYFPAHYQEIILKVYQRYKAHCSGWVELPIDESILRIISDELELPIDDIRKPLFYAMHQITCKISLEEYMDRTDGEGKFFYPRSIDNCNFETAVIEKDLKDIINQVLKTTLSTKEATILKMRNGIGYSHAMTLEEVGIEFNVTRERIRQIEAKALRKLRHPARSKYLKDYL